MSDIVFLNGDYLPRERALIPIDDRGFYFGDAVYEVLRAVNGRYVEPERHVARLARGIRELELPDPVAFGMDPMAAAEVLLDRNALRQGQATVYIQVSRGAVTPRRHAFPPAGTRPTVLVSTAPFVPKTKECTNGVAAITHPDLRWQRCDLKTVNLLPNVLANQQATARGAYEAILLREGIATEGTHSSLFAVVGGELRTHPNGPWILPGVTRDVVLELARAAGVRVREEAVTARELAAASELFLTGTTTDVMPVTQVDGRPVGSGTPGPITRQLARLFAAHIAAEAAPVTTPRG
ncbi:MAG TPA: aminotransferase class IV [Gemmatimonadales bacterium]|nr:aminotransferase class IV [Gemmatimonadales bacterium]